MVSDPALLKLHVVLESSLTDIMADPEAVDFGDSRPLAVWYTGDLAVDYDPVRRFYSERKKVTQLLDMIDGRWCY
jgi:hypothetical protein